jgi:hypothetical protein
MLIQNPNYSPYVHFKSPLLYDWCMFIEFEPFIMEFHDIIMICFSIHIFFLPLDIGNFNP